MTSTVKAPEGPGQVRLSKPVTLSIIILVCTTVAGVVAGIAASPLNDWLLTFWGGAPGFLRLAANLPAWLAVVVMAGVGLYFGGWLADRSRKDTLALEVGFTGLTLEQYESTRHIPREQIASIVLDGNDLVLFDAADLQLARNDARDLNKRQLESVLTSFGYPIAFVVNAAGSTYRRWTEGHPDLDAKEHRLMHNRVQALKDKDFLAASGFTDELLSSGVVVRDRRRVPEFRRANPHRS